jgi:CMP/dCMP kinase
MVAASLPAALDPATAGEGRAKRGAELIKQHRFASPSGRRLQLIRVVFMSSNRQSFHRVVAIDGPAASGKSSVARELAQRLGFAHVNSGAIYRAITWHILQKGVDAGDSDRVTQTAESAEITCYLQDNEARIFIDNVDPTDYLREDRVNESVSRVSSVPRVRRIVEHKTREYARSHDVVMEGRDIGSVVFPDTPYKFYIVASHEVRLRRRAAQGQRDEITMRDQADSSRLVSPLVLAKDAHVIDTSHLTIEGVVSEVVARLKEMGLKVSA